VFFILFHWIDVNSLKLKSILLNSFYQIM